LVKFPNPNVHANAFPPASLHTGPTSVSFGLPNNAKNRFTSDPVPRGNRPEVLFAIVRASPASRSAKNFFAITSSAFSHETGAKSESAAPF
jgi:hypothetical protein